MRADMKLTTDAAAAEATKAGTKQRVYYEIGYTDGTGEIFAPADKSFLAEMVTLAGADAITTGDPNNYADPAREADRARSADRSSSGSTRSIRRRRRRSPPRPGWNVMTAVKDNRSDRSTTSRSPVRDHGSPPGFGR